MQQPPQMMPMIPPPFPNANITTEQIQKYLDENKKLILAILDNQNLGKLAECAHFQVKLQQNLMYLAAIADAQPQVPTVPPQMPPHAVMQQGGHFMQHPQVGPQPPVFAQKVPSQFNPQQMQEQQQQQQHPLHHQHPYSIQGQMGMRPGANNGIHAMHHAEVTPSGSGGPTSTPGLGELARGGASGSSADGRGGEQDAEAAALEASTGNGTGSTAAGHGSGDAEPSFLKGPEEGGK
ncbi:GRF1-interacting factor 2-like isoform X2 [Magnolia sinica]|uniref:GRF1-interacting factor 2-like isoform X2 n=1 Tax=Magnolia sinica TaxID=86752 RepID=UPI00265885F9|nr:GRF1-interacting factor 2-like isoform X2 [Magnolia sinica]XP_058104951.1 GRF1-interacting factor 2-like isoform X2 [Magnolia sinica]XP_058104952.1 GRF1-interacting factor 2-like isoform X2 [Magnolia sinica]XP_058104953.1 GRF1-interacting factor 2-like isoform X2 [Magnolia sinica]XP_058104954.1 GRF1-interacting factor 2-like isoform X2 [Magnolia sinica]